MEIIEADLQELRDNIPHAKTIQLLSANPLALSYDRLAPILELVNRYLPELEFIYAQTRVADMRNKTVEELKNLRELGIREISFGFESGDDWTLGRINMGYTAAVILEQTQKVNEAGIRFWATFLNGVAGAEHSRDHAIHTAEIFNQIHPMVVGSGSLTLFPGTPLLEEAEHGEFMPLTERERLEEMKLFVEHLECDCAFTTHHTNMAQIRTSDFLSDKSRILDMIEGQLKYADMDQYAAIRNAKTIL